MTATRLLSGAGRPVRHFEGCVIEGSQKAGEMVSGMELKFWPDEGHRR
jgi:hypothetical protein